MITSIFKKNIFWISFLFFLVAIFTIKLPPIFITPIPSTLFTSHIIAKILITILALFLFINPHNRKNILNKNSILTVTLFYFITQSASVVKATDQFLFLKDYHSLIISLLLLYVAFIFGKNSKCWIKINRLIVIMGFIVISIDFLFYLFPTQFMSLVGDFLQKELVTLYSFNLQRGRYNLYLNTELFIPFFINMIILSDKNKLGRLIGAISTFLIIYLTFVSNFRHRLLFLVVVVIFYSLFLFINRHKVNLKRIVPIFFVVLISGVIVSFFLVRTFSQQDIVNRLFLEDETEDISSINLRIDNFNKSIELIKSSPFFGVGLGNYQLYAENKKWLINNQLSKDFYSGTRQESHSIISKTIGETGLLGLLGLSVMVIFFLRRDWIFIKKNSSFKIFAYIVTFWGFFILSLITPSITLFRGGWMWLVRGILEGRYQFSSDSRRSSK